MKRTDYADAIRKAILDAPINTPAILGDPEVLEAWIRRYREFSCDYLIENLADAELPAWAEAFTALHEMVAPVWCHVNDGLTESDAWAQFDAPAQLAVARLYGQNSPDFRYAGFLEHYEGFVRFLADKGVMETDVATRIVAEYRACFGRTSAA